MPYGSPRDWCASPCASYYSHLQFLTCIHCSGLNFYLVQVLRLLIFVLMVQMVEKRETAGWLFSFKRVPFFIPRLQPEESMRSRLPCVWHFACDSVFSEVSSRFGIILSMCVRNIEWMNPILKDVQGHMRSTEVKHWKPFDFAGGQRSYTHIRSTIGSNTRNLVITSSQWREIYKKKICSIFAKESQSLWLSGSYIFSEKCAGARTPSSPGSNQL